jgi:hypothetical protein
MVLTAYSALSLVTGLSCHHRLADHPARLDASVGASGPHDFAVRHGAARPASPRRPSHPAPNVRDDREAPLLRDGTGGDVLLIWGRDKAEYFCKGDWTTQITLIRLDKSAFWRKLPARRLDTHGPHFVNRGLRHCLLPDRCRFRPSIAHQDPGRIAQRESVPFTRERSKVRSLVRPPSKAP